MQTETTPSGTQTSGANAERITVCPNCRAQMPSEMRFCRACGFRLGEGVAEFTETVRFQNPPTGSQQQAKQTTDAPRAAAADPFANLNSCADLNDWAAFARDIGQNMLKIVVKVPEIFPETQREEPPPRHQPQPKPKSHRSNWIGLLILIIIISVVSNGGFRGASNWRSWRESLRGLSGTGGHSSARSWVGTSDFKKVDNGVTFEVVKPPGSPADKAGLVGGDLITTFDGHPVKTPSEFIKLLTATPVGKTVEVIYIRDGETKTAKLATVSEDEMERLEELADDRADGYVGIGLDRERVAVPGTNLYGVRLNDIRLNNPADIAGIKNGDIVIEFDGVPIRTNDELESRTRRAVPGSTVKVVVMRGGQRLEIPVKVGLDD